MKNIRHVINFSFILLLFVYFTYHTIIGNYSILSYFKLSEQLLEKKITLNKLNTKIESKNRKISRIKDNIDLDYLDELAREKLGYARADELVIYRGVIDK